MALAASRLSLILLCIGITLVTTATLLHIAGMSTPHWAKNQAGSVGLFEVCSNKLVPYSINEDGKAESHVFKRVCTDLDFDSVSLKHQAAQVLVFLGLISGITGAGAGIVFLMIILLSHAGVSRRVVISATSVSVFSCLLAICFIISAVSIFVDRLYPETVGLRHYNYSMALCCLAAVLFLSGAVLMAVASKYIKTSGGNVEVLDEDRTNLKTTKLSDSPSHYAGD